MSSPNWVRWLWHCTRTGTCWPVWRLCGVAQKRDHRASEPKCNKDTVTIERASKTSSVGCFSSSHLSHSPRPRQTSLPTPVHVCTGRSLPQRHERSRIVCFLLCTRGSLCDRARRCNPQLQVLLDRFHVWLHPRQIQRLIVL